MNEPTFGDPGDCHHAATVGGVSAWRTAIGIRTDLGECQCPLCGKAHAIDDTIVLLSCEECGEYFTPRPADASRAINPTTLIETLIRDGRVTIAGLGQVSIEWSGGKPFGLRIMPTTAVMERIRSMKP